MRVHGDKKIRRRKGVPELRHYQDAREMLQEDFQDICGYCGKNRKMMYEHFQIDHFVPKSLDEDRINDYYNLVLACQKCNRAKWDKWPTKDKDKPNDGENGFVDPATEEFDEHIMRDITGYVVGRTPLGKNMCKLLHLDIRRSDLFWKISRLYHQQERLEQLFDQGVLDEIEKNYYIRNNKLLKSYISRAMEKGE